MSDAWAFGTGGRIVNISEDDGFPKCLYLMVHLPSKKAFWRENYFTSEAVFQDCIDLWNAMMPEEWLHLNPEDMEGWDLVL